jgi:hypothetical protein
VVLRAGDALKIRMRRAGFRRDTGRWDPFVKLESSTLATTLRTRYAGPEPAITWKRKDTVLAVTGHDGTFAVK